MKMFRKAQALLPARGGPRRSDKQMLRVLRHLLRKHGYLTGRIINELPLAAHENSYRARFGSLTNAYARVGWKRPKWSPLGTGGTIWSDQMLLSGLRELANRVGYLSSTVIDHCPDLPSASYVRCRFGSLNRAYELSGFPMGSHRELMRAVVDRRRAQLEVDAEGCRPWGRKQYSTAELIAGLRRLVKENGYLSAKLIGADPSVASWPVYARRFGSLLNAYGRAGWRRTKSEIYHASARRRCAAGYAQAAASAIPSEAN